jgi:hypothetical protein
MATKLYASQFAMQWRSTAMAAWLRLADWLQVEH